MIEELTKLSVQPLEAEEVAGRGEPVANSTKPEA